MARPDVGDRLKRLLVIIPWLVENGGAPLAAVADRFGVSPQQLERDLQLASFCGLPPYTGDVLLEIDVNPDWVSVALPQQLDRTLRLTRSEGFAVLAAGRTAIAAVPGEGAASLASALDKLEAVLGDPDQVVVDLDEPEFLDDIRAAAGAHERLEVDYFSASRGETSVRTVDPFRVFAAEGRWYVDVVDHTAGDVRRFRVDRVETVRRTGETFTPPKDAAAPPPGRPFEPGPDLPRVTLELPASARWVVEAFPTDDVRELDGGRLRVVLAVSGRAWLDRLLLRVGPEAKLLEPEELLDAGPAAAARVLARYRGGRSADASAGAGASGG